MSKPEEANHVLAEAAGDAVAIQRSRLPRRLGCWLLVAVWFAILMTPCGLFYLAAQGEIRLEHGQIPDPHTHPRLLMSLISESDDRGLRIERSTILAEVSDTALCVETAVTFLLWESSGGNQNVAFCDCYQRQDADAAWNLVSTYGGACAPTDPGS